jgi:hypothetical protein
VWVADREVRLEWAEEGVGALVVVDGAVEVYEDC